MEDLLSELRSIDPKKIKNSLFNGITTKAYCYAVIDTDTIKCIFKYKSEPVKVICRLNNIDSPEKKSQIQADRDLSNKGTIFVKNLILNKIITLVIDKTDKYGRFLCDVYYDNDNDISLNDKLLSGGFVREYHGGAKTLFNYNDDGTIDI